MSFFSSKKVDRKIGAGGSKFTGGTSGLFGKSPPVSGGGAGQMFSGKTVGGTSGGLFGAGQQQQGGMFGTTMSKGTSGAGGGLFQGPSFGMGGRSQQTTSGGLFGSKGSTGSSIFGGGTAPGGGLFGAKPAGTGTTQPSTTQFGGLGVGGGDLFSRLGLAKTVGTIGLQWTKSDLGKRDNMVIMCINSMRRLADRSLDELRMEDYFALKNKQVSDDVIKQLQEKWVQNQQEAERGGLLSTLGVERVKPEAGLFRKGVQTGTGAPMFAGIQQQQQPGGGLFGAQTGGPGGGIFGAAAQPQQGVGVLGKPQGGGLFPGGGVQIGQQQPVGGIFGPSVQQGGPFGMGTQPVIGGLFGAPKQQVQPGGLFGPKEGVQLGQQPSTGLFGTTGTQQGGGLFPRGGAQLFQQPQGGLFGAGAQPVSGGLFAGGAGGGISGVPTQVSGGLFGTTAPQQPSNLFTGGGVSTTGERAEGLFGARGVQPTLGILPSQAGAEKIFFETPRLQQVQPEMQPETPFKQEPLRRYTGPYAGLAQKKYNLFGKTLGAEKESEMYDKHATGRESLFTSVMKSPKSRFVPYNVFERRRPDIEDYPYYARSIELSPRSSPSKMRPQRKARSESLRRLSTPEPDYLDFDLVTLESPPRPKKLSISPELEQKLEAQRSEKLARATSSIRLFVVFVQEGQESKTFTIEMNKNSPVSDIKTTILKQIFDTTPTKLSKYKLLHHNTLLREDVNIKDSKLHNNDRIYLVIDTTVPDEPETKPSSEEQIKENLVSEELLPKIPEEYQSDPSLVAMSQMTEEELSHVKDFAIWNDKVKVTFLSEVDLRGLDLGKILILSDRNVDIYPESRGCTLPEPGTGLNIPTIIEFYNWKLPKKYKHNLNAYLEKLRKWAEGMNALLESYDPEKQITRIRLENFGGRKSQ